jgi:glycosyltransferase involved in cell wall biosynthesis
LASARPARLLKFVTRFGVGGTERQVINVVERLDRSRFDLHLACFVRAGAFLDELDGRRRPPVTEYRIRNLYDHRALEERLRFARYLRQHRIEIMHAYSFYANVFAIPAARLAGVPVVLAAIRDTGAYQTPLQQRVQRWMCRLADRVVANADAVKRWLVGEGYDARKISVIRNGIDLARFAPRPAGTRLREELGLPRTAPLVAVLSRVSPLKGLQHFLQAAAELSVTCPDARFLIVGEPSPGEDEYERELRRSATALGLDRRVIFTGLRLDVPEVLSEVAVSVLPSLSEGLPNSVLESMAAEVPVVATRVGGTAEAVDDGVTGLLVPPGDTPALTRAISRLLQDRDLARRLAGAGRQRVVERFSIEGMVRQTERLYDELLGARRRPAPGDGPGESPRLDRRAATTTRT